MADGLIALDGARDRVKQERIDALVKELEHLVEHAKRGDIESMFIVSTGAVRHRGILPQGGSFSFDDFASLLGATIVAMVEQIHDNLNEPPGAPTG